VRRNLKEAGGKVPARGIRSAYKAELDRVSLHNKTKPNVIRGLYGKCDG
jgi:hypothetical protein